MRTLLRFWSARTLLRLSLPAFLGASLIGVALLFLDTPTTTGTSTCTINWTGSGGNNSWFTAANWDANRLPGTSDVVCIPTTTPAVTVAYNQSTTTQILSLQSQEPLALSAGTLSFTDTTQTSTLNSSLIWSGGTLGGAGNLTVNGPITWSGGEKTGGKLTIGGGMTITGSGTEFLFGGGTIDNPSGQTITIKATGNLSLGNGGTLLNEAGGVIDDQTDFGVTGNGTGTITNAGTFQKSGGSGVTSLANGCCTAITVNNSGTMAVTSGILGVDASGSSTGGIYTVAAGSTLRFAAGGPGGAYTLDSASSITGAGNVEVRAGSAVTLAAGAVYNITGTTTVAGGSLTFNNTPTSLGSSVTLSNGTLSFNQNASYSPPLTWSGGTLDGTGNVTWTGPITWSGGQKTGGTLITAGGMTIIGSGTEYIYGGGTIDNPSGQTITIKATGNMSLGNSGTLLNEAGGLIDDQTDFTFSNNGTPTFTNAGTFQKSGGTGVTSITDGSFTAVTINNSGTFAANSGTLGLDGFGSGTGGRFTVAAGATLRFGAPGPGGTTVTYTLDSASSITGSGNVVVQGLSAVSLAAGSTYNITGSTTVAGGSLTFNNTPTSLGRSVTLSNGTLSFNQNASSPASLTWSGGSLDGSANVTWTGPITWSGGSKTGGKLTIGGGMTITGTGTENVFNGGTIDNPSGQTITIKATGNLSIGNGGTLVNEAGGLIDDQTDFTINNNLGSTGTITNAGTFQKSGGTGFTLITNGQFSAVTINNSGTIAANSGTLGLDGFGSSTGGTYTVAAGATLDFGAPSPGGSTAPYTLDGTSTITGAGNVRVEGVSAVTLAAGSTYNITGATTLAGGGSSLTFNSSASTGTYTQTSGTLGIVLGGSSTCSTFGQLNASGTASIAGRLNVSLANGCSPTPTQGFQIMTFASSTGTFSPVTVPPVNGQPMAVTYNSTNVTVGAGKTNQTITFGPIPNHTYGDPDFTVSATASSGLPVSFAASGNCTNSGNTVHITGAGSCTVTASQPGNGSYNPAPNVSQSFQIAKANQTITFGSLPNHTYGDSPFAVSATGGGSTSPVSFSVTGNCSISGSTVTITGAGSCTVTTSQAGDANYNPATSVSQTFTIAKAQATITLVQSSLSATYDGTAKSVTATTTPAGLGYSVTYNGSSTAPTNAGSYAVVATISDANYQGSASGTLVIAQASQTISFGPLSNHTYGDAPFTVGATASSGLPVSFSVGSTDQCTISGSTVTITGAGSCTVTASQAGNANYSPAASVSQTFTIARANATLTVDQSALSQTYDGTPKSVTVTTNPAGLSGVSLAYSQNGSPVTNPTNAGSYDFVASLNNPNYQATSATGTLVIAKADQTVTFGALADKTYGDPDFAVSATASSGLPVSFSAAGSCTVSGGTVHLTGAGGCTITASQAGNSNYNPATSVSQSFQIAKGSATLTLDATTTTQAYDGSPKTVTATTTPAGLSYSVTYNGSATAPTEAGSYNVTATVTDPNYQGSVSGTLVITQASQTISFGTISNHTYGDAPFTVSATASSGLPVSFSVGSSDQCTISGSTVTITGAGSCTVTASQTGNTDYSAATSISQTFTIAKAPATVTLSNLSATYDGTAKQVTVTTVPSGLTNSVTYNGSSTAPTDAGSYSVTATVNDANYQGSASDTLVIAKAGQTISFGALVDKTYGDPDFTVSGSASSGLGVSFTTSGSCTNSGATVHITGAGSCTVTASQAGNNDYNPATSISQTFTIAKAQASLTLDASTLSQTYDGSAKSVTGTTTPAGLSYTVTFSQNGSPVTNPTNAGSYSVTATVNDANYQGSASGTLVIAKAGQTISFTALPNHTYGDAPLTVSATASSGLAVSFSVGATDQCTISGNTVTITGAGSCTVTASQAGNGNYNPATSVSQTFSIAKANQTITFGTLANKTYGDPDFTLSATTSSWLAVTFTAGASDQCSVSGTTVHLTGAGTCTVTASQAGSSNYNPAVSVSQTFTIAKGTATVTLSKLSATYDGKAHYAAATTTPTGLSVSLTYTQNGNPITAPTNAGSYTVQATVNDANYQGSASGTLVIAQASQTITFNPLSDVTYGAPPFTVSATGGGSGNPVTFAATPASVCTASGANDSTITVAGAGTCTVTASQAGTANYAAASTVQRQFAVKPAGATVSIPAADAIPVKMPTAGGTASVPLTTTLSATQGTLTTAAVTFTLTPLSPGGRTYSCTVSRTNGQLTATAGSGSTCSSPTMTGTGSPLTVGCTFSGVAPGLYQLTVSAGANYTNGSGSQSGVVTVYDPSLGYTVGGGSFTRTETSGNVPITFGFYAKVINGQVQGAWLAVEHRSSGDLVLQSNSLTSLSIVPGTGTQETAFLQGTTSYQGTSGYTFLAKGIDADSSGPSTNPDQYGQQVKTPSGSVVSDLSYNPISLTSGDIHVP